MMLVVKESIESFQVSRSLLLKEKSTRHMKINECNPTDLKRFLKFLYGIPIINTYIPIFSAQHFLSVARLILKFEVDEGHQFLLATQLKGFLDRLEAEDKATVRNPVVLVSTHTS